MSYSLRWQRLNAESLSLPTICLKVCASSDSDGASRTIYYRATHDSLEVLAVWHTSRGKQPAL